MLKKQILICRLIIIDHVRFTLKRRTFLYGLLGAVSDFRIVPPVCQTCKHKFRRFALVLVKNFGLKLILKCQILVHVVIKHKDAIEILADIIITRRKKGEFKRNLKGALDWFNW